MRKRFGVHALGSGRCDRRVRDQTLPEALEWVWRDHELTDPRWW